MLALRTSNEADFIPSMDSALDHEAEGFVPGYLNFYDTGDRSGLKLKPGSTPTVFRVRRLSQRAFEHVMRQLSDVDRVREAIAYGLVSVTDWGDPGLMQLGRVKGDHGERLDAATLEKIFAYYDVAKEVAERVMSFSTVPPSRGQR